MGRPSDKRFSAQRLGKRERARRKNRRKCRGSVSAFVGGVGTYHVVAGRKKYRKVVAHCDRTINAHRTGDSSTSKSASEIKRPLYTITLSPLL